MVAYKQLKVVACRHFNQTENREEAGYRCSGHRGVEDYRRPGLHGLLPIISKLIEQ